MLSLLKLRTLYLDWMVIRLLEISNKLPLTAFSFFNFTVMGVPFFEEKYSSEEKTFSTNF